MLELFDLLNTRIVEAMDYVFGWMLFLQRDLLLFTVAIMTSLCLSFVRKWTTDQDWLGRADADKVRLGQLIKEARKTKNKEAIKRYKATITHIKVKSLKFEGKPMLWSILPVALLATWAFSRLAFVPPPQGQPVTVRAYLPKSYIGQPIHVVPDAGLEATNGWIQTVVEDKPLQVTNMWDRCNAEVCAFLGMTPPVEAVAEWKILSHDTKPHMLKFRYDGRTYEKEFLAGTRQYATPVMMYEKDGKEDPKVVATELVMKPMKLFDYVGAIDFLFLSPWLVAYLLIAIPGVTLIRRLFRIY